MKKQKGTILVLILVLVVSIAALGGVLYYFGYFSKTNPSTEQPQTTQQDDGVKDRSGDISKLSGSDEVEDIEKDLNSTDLNSLDSEVLGAKTTAEEL